MTPTPSIASAAETTARERFFRKVEKTDSCWLWIGPTSSKGYGMFLPGRPLPRAYAHRYAYQMLVGQIPDGLVLDHLCRVRNCVNPAHLEPVTNRENLMRGVGFGPKNAAKTHCPAGHPLTGDNLYMHPVRNYRECRACKRVRDLRAYHEYRADQRRARAATAAS